MTDSGGQIFNDPFMSLQSFVRISVAVAVQASYFLITVSFYIVFFTKLTVSQVLTVNSWTVKAELGNETETPALKEFLTRYPF